MSNHYGLRERKQDKHVQTIALSIGSSKDENATVKDLLGTGVGSRKRKQHDEVVVDGTKEEKKAKQVKMKKSLKAAKKPSKKPTNIKGGGKSAITKKETGEKVKRSSKSK